MEQAQNVQKILKSYKKAIYIAYGASLFAFILAIAGVSDGLWTDFIVYLFFAVIINIFKNKISATIIATLSAIQFIFVIISIWAGSSQAIELLISAVVFTNLFTFYKLIAKIGSIKKLKKQYGNTK
ncbi:MAG: hypothetical protein ABH818_03205 [Patescibacteria group bacterium]